MPNMESIMTIKQIFNERFEDSMKQKIVVAVQLPTGIELIINDTNLEGKMAYYNNAYNDYLELKANTSIKIINYMFV